MFNDVLPPANPYHHDYGDDVSTAPFAGRQSVFGRLYRHLARSDRRGGLCILGRRHTGKTALLYAIKAVFRDSTLPVVISLRDTPIDTHTAWVLALAQAATAALIDHQFSVMRLSALEAPGDDPADWFENTFLPALLASIRGSRHLLWLIDDADEWLNAIQAGVLPDDHVAQFHRLLTRHHNIDLVLALDAESESDLPAFAPLVGLTDVIRLDYLTRDDAIWLLREPIGDLYTVDDEAINQAQAITGGAPGLLQQVGYLMFRKGSVDAAHTVMTGADVKTFMPTVYAYGERDFIEIWRALTADERLVLTAASSISHTNPSVRIDAPALETWLIETEYPLDVVAINAALRGLEYRETVVSTPEDGIQVNGDCLQLWLIEHARLGERSGRAASGDDRRASQQRRARIDVSERLAARSSPGRSTERSTSVRLIVLFGLALLISTAILVASVVSTPRTPPAPLLQPTATLFVSP